MSPQVKHETREAWLHAAIEHLAEVEFMPVGGVVPSSLRVSVGFPYGSRGGKSRVAIGQYWPGELIQDEVPHIYISPTLGDPVRVLDVLTHELVHAALPPTEGHGKAFKALATAVGLTGKMRATVAGPELEKRLQALSKRLGEYPHGAANPKARPTKKQGTRMLKLECPACGFLCRTTQKWLDETGTPYCGCGAARLETDAGDAGEGSESDA